MQVVGARSRGAEGKSEAARRGAGGGEKASPSLAQKIFSLAYVLFNVGTSTKIEVRIRKFTLPRNSRV